MLTVIANPVGIDVPIRKMQEYLHTRLMTSWGLDPEDADDLKIYECYGRCYRNKKDNSYIAEVYTGSNQYKEVYWNDSLNAISFFGTSTSVRHDKAESTEVHIVFFVNLAKLKPSLTNRADEEVRIDVLNAIGTHRFGFRYTGYETGIENVLREYPGSRRDDRLKAADMHPIHCFRLNFTLNYNNNNCF